VTSLPLRRRELPPREAETLQNTRGKQKRHGKKPASGRTATKTKSRYRPPAADEIEIARLSRELNDARDQQAAMAEVLHAISRSKFEFVRRCSRAWPKR